MTDWRRNTEMGQYQIRITELAEEDLENAGDYIAYDKIYYVIEEDTM